MAQNLSFSAIGLPQWTQKDVFRSGSHAVVVCTTAAGTGSICTATPSEESGVVKYGFEDVELNSAGLGSVLLVMLTTDVGSDCAEIGVDVADWKNRSRAGA